MQSTLDKNVIENSQTEQQHEVLGEKVGIIATLFGCWHKDLSRPFSNSNGSHRTCLKCGAIKHFDSQTLKTTGPFYYPKRSQISADK
jgi:hypothetical protein